MDYHSDRFQDHSLLIFKDKILEAVFPANLLDQRVYSHQGLTFGGLICNRPMSLDNLNTIMKLVIHYYKSNKIKSLYIKLIPNFFDESFFRKFEKSLQYLTAENRYNDRTMVVDLESYMIHKSKLKRFRRYADYGFEIFKTTDFEPFWNTVLIPRLQSKHGVLPVHSLTEIQLLADQFPNNIFQYGIAKDGQWLAGITLFVHDRIVKSQYGATTEAGEAVAALDFLFITLIRQYESEGFRYFDMGSVRSDDPSGINQGLWKQKQELGCIECVQPHYELQL